MIRWPQANANRQKKVTKKGPFKLPLIGTDYPPISHLLANAILEIKELPNFHDDSRIVVFSDFSGEHKGAHFHTYSFLIVAFDKIGPFELMSQDLRRKHGILEPYSEFAFKDLTYGPRSRALPGFLSLVENYVHGALVTVAIDKEVESLFGPSKKEGHQLIESMLAEEKLGLWKGEVAEKMLRVCHSIAVFAALTTKNGQRFMWHCDNDSINEDAKNHDFKDTQQIFGRVLNLYTKNNFEIFGFGKSFEKKSHMDDLLSVADLAAGVMQDVLQANKTGSSEIPGGDEKKLLLNWMAKQGKWLTKINLHIGKNSDGQLVSGLARFKPAKRHQNP
jgi:hypothetical protein